MTVEQILAEDLDLRGRRVGATWTIEVRALDLRAEATKEEGGFQGAARKLLALASDEAGWRTSAMARHELMEKGKRRLTKLLAAIDALGDLCGPVAS